MTRPTMDTPLRLRRAADECARRCPMAPRRRTSRRLDDLDRTSSTTDDDDDDEDDYVELPRVLTRGRRVLTRARRCSSSWCSSWPRRRPLGAAPDRPARCAGRAARDRDPRGVDVGRHRQAPGRRGRSSPATSCGSWYLRVNGGGPFEAGIYELADEQRDGRRHRRPRRRARAHRRALLHDARGPHRAGDRSPAWPTPRRASASTLRRMQQLLDSGPDPLDGQPADQPSNEGILFPETYRVEADADELAGARS